MMLRAYTLFDTKAVVYHSPFFVVTDAAACRMLQDLAADTNTTVGRHPGDFTLYFVGHFDDQAGGMVPIAPKVHVADAVSLLSHAQQDMFARAPDPNGQAREV